jgi:predicted ATPase/class 3 adenylate cyclase
MSEPAAAAERVAALPAGIVTFLFTDVVGSTRLFQQHGEAFVAALNDLQDAVRLAVEDAGGVVVNTEGDGTFAVFESAADGVRAATAAQAAIGRLDGEPRLRIRAGLHTGYAQPLQRDYLALAVHVASRVESAAAAEQVLASGETIAALGTVPDGAADLGLFELRDVVEPVRLWRLAGPSDPPRASPLRRTNVQPAHTSLVGRDELLADLADRMAMHRLVTLLGTGGVGKTRLASELAGRLAPSFPGGAWLIELAGIHSAGAVPGAVRSVLAVALTDAADDALVAELNRRGPTLLVLDNCEHVLDAAADLADQLLRSCPATRVLATSREALELPGEQIVRVRPLDHDELDGSAEELFRQRIERAGRTASAEEAGVVADICRLLDGVPLAIELAASRGASMPLAELRAALERDAHLVPLTGRRGEVRQRSLDNLVDWSVRLLDPAEREDLACLSSFAARFTGADAAVLLEGARGHRPPAIAELVRRGLVDLDGDRYRILFSVRMPMQNRLGREPELAAATDAALVAWADRRVSAARALGWRAAAELLAPERANLEAALHAAARRELNAPRVLQMLDRIWDSEGSAVPAGLRSLLEGRLAQPLPDDDVDGLQMLLSIMDVTKGVGLSSAMSSAVEVASKIVAAARELGDAELLVHALSTLGPACASAGRIAEAQDTYREAIDLAAHGGQWHRPARDLVNMAITFHVGPDPLRAVPWYETAAQTAARTGDEDNRAVALVNLGDVLMTAGRLREASEALRRGVKAMAHMTRSETVARVILADVLVRLDEPNSLEYAREAERDMQRLLAGDASMADYLARLRITIAAAEERDGAHRGRT